MPATASPPRAPQRAPIYIAEDNSEDEFADIAFRPYPRRRNALPPPAPAPAAGPSQAGRRHRLYVDEEEEADLFAALAEDLSDDDDDDDFMMDLAEFAPARNGTGNAGNGRRDRNAQAGPSGNRNAAPRPPAPAPAAPRGFMGRWLPAALRVRDEAPLQNDPAPAGHVPLGLGGGGIFRRRPIATNARAAAANAQVRRELPRTDRYNFNINAFPNYRAALGIYPHEDEDDEGPAGAHFVRNGEFFVFGGGYPGYQARHGAGPSAPLKYELKLSHPEPITKDFTRDIPTSEPPTTTIHPGSALPSFGGSARSGKRSRSPSPDIVELKRPPVCVSCLRRLRLEQSGDRRLWILPCGHIVDGRCIKEARERAREKAGLAVSADKKGNGYSGVRGRGRTRGKMMAAFDSEVEDDEGGKSAREKRAEKRAMGVPATPSKASRGRKKTDRKGKGKARATTVDLLDADEGSDMDADVEPASADHSSDTELPLMVGGGGSASQAIDLSEAELTPLDPHKKMTIVLGPTPQKRAPPKPRTAENGVKLAWTDCPVIGCEGCKAEGGTDLLADDWRGPVEMFI